MRKMETLKFKTLDERMGRLITDARNQIIKELDPTDEQLGRAKELHDRSIVCDSYGQASSCHWAGLAYSVEMEQYVDRQMEIARDDEERRKMIQGLRQETLPWRATSFVDDSDYQEDLHDLWKTTGLTVGTESFGNAWVFGQDLRGTLADYLPAIARVGYVHENVHFLEKVVRFDQIISLKERNRIGIIWHCQQPDFFFAGLEDRDHPELPKGPKIEDPIGNLNTTYGLGFRMTQLTNGRKNQIGCAHSVDSDTGVTDIGRELIARMNELGMVIDLAHSGPQTMLDAIEASADPVVTSHGACRSVAIGGKSKGRNMTDEAIKALAEKGGYIGITLPPNLLGDFGIERFFAHLEHAIKMVGIEHVGIGTDETGLALRGEPSAFHRKPADFPEVSSTPYGGIKLKGTEAYWHYDHEAYPMLWTNWPYWSTLAMVMRGYSDQDISGLIGGNFLRVIRPIMEKRHDSPVV